MNEEEFLVSLKRSSESPSFGISLLQKKPDFPPIVHHILEGSPAFQSGKVKIGDVILKVNDTDVLKYTTKELLKCLRLSTDPVSLRIRRDPTQILKLEDEEEQKEDTKNGHNFIDPSAATEIMSNNHKSSIINETKKLKNKPPKFEAFMMTGEHILNVSKNTANITKLMDQSRHNHHHHHHHHNNTMLSNLKGNNSTTTSSVPNSPAENEMGRKEQYHHQKTNTKTEFIRTSHSDDQLQITPLMQSNFGNQQHVNDVEIDDNLASSLLLLDTRPDDVSDRIVWTYNAPISGETASSASSSSNSPTTTSVSSSIMSNQSGSRFLPINNYSLPSNQHQPLDYNSMSEAISNLSSPGYHDDEEDSVVALDDLLISDHSDSDSTLLGPDPSMACKKKFNKHKLVIQVPGGTGSTLEEEITAKNEDDLSEDDDSLSSDIDSLTSFKCHLSPKQLSNMVDMPSAIRLAKRLFNLEGFKKSDVSRHLSKNNEFSKAVAEEYLKHFQFDGDRLDVALRKFLKKFSLTGETQERERVLVHFSNRYLNCNPGTFNSQDAVHTLTCAIMLLNTDLHQPRNVIGRKMTQNEFIENLAGLNEGADFPKDVLKHLYHAIKSDPLEWAQDDDDGNNGQINSSMMRDSTQNSQNNSANNRNTIEYKKGYVMRKCCFEANGKRTPFHKRSWKMFYCTIRGTFLFLHKDENNFRKNTQNHEDFEQQHRHHHHQQNLIRLHHSIATNAHDYRKKQYVFRLQTADQAEYLFQTSDSKELQSWIDTINFVAATYSAPPMEAPVGSHKKFQRPLLPSNHTKFYLHDQLIDHEERLIRLEQTLEEHRKNPPEKNAKSLIMQNYKEKDAYLTFEITRYRTYIYILRCQATVFANFPLSALNPPIIETISPTNATTTVTIGEELDDMVEDPNYVVGGGGGAVAMTSLTRGELVPPPIPERRTSSVMMMTSPTVNRYSYRQAIYFSGYFGEGANFSGGGDNGEGAAAYDEGKLIRGAFI